jgi:demethylmenaquinone methyltransferase/2-methoxy-6-polyprenyl-1,4-benzoquinol methylase
MKVLESAPSRYDRGIRLLTLGRIDQAYDRLASLIQPDQRVLDLGCGTGALSLRAAQKGATVRGIDPNPEMLDIAQTRAEAASLDQAIQFCEMGVAELDGESPQSYDVVTSGLCLSELTEDERGYAIGQAYRLLKSGGLLLVADEVVPRHPIKRLLHWLVRAPLAVVVYLLTQTTTHPLRALPQALQRAGFELQAARWSALEDWIELVARKPGQ